MTKRDLPTYDEESDATLCFPCDLETLKNPTPCYLLLRDDGSVHELVNVGEEGMMVFKDMPPGWRYVHGYVDLGRPRILSCTAVNSKPLCKEYILLHKAKWYINKFIGDKIDHTYDIFSDYNSWYWKCFAKAWISHEEWPLVARMVKKYRGYRYQAREGGWEDVGEPIYWADNSIEQPQVNKKTGERRNRMVTGPGGDACY